MWQSVTRFFSTRVFSVGSVGFKVWHVAFVLLLVGASTGGAFAFVQAHANRTSNVPQNVIVFVDGLNSSISNCQEGTFLNSSPEARLPLPLLLQQEIGLQYPYTKGCDVTGHSYWNDTSSAIFFSYKDGTMDSTNGYWKPKDYQQCDVNDDTVSQDIQTFEHMLDQYHSYYPNATFTLVGHSLGGLVALQSAYDYAVVRHHTDINKVITIDSPLEGVLPAVSGSIVNFAYAHCGKRIPVGEVIPKDLYPLGNASVQSQPFCTPQQLQKHIGSGMILSKCAAQALTQQAGVGVITLGNVKDSLYCGPFTYSNKQLLQYTCYSQFLTTAYSVFSQQYTLPPIDTSSNNSAPGHGTILKTDKTEQDIVRYILAPVVTIKQPVANTTSMQGATGIPVLYSAQVHCQWGTANRATANIAVQGSSPYFAGTSVPSGQSDALSLQGVVNLPTSITAPQGTFYVDAGGNACHYPASVSAVSQPTSNDYYGGAAAGIPFAFDGGKFAVGLSGQLYAGRPANGTIPTGPVDYSSYNQGLVNNSIQSIAWSNDGNKIAYLVETSAGVSDPASGIVSTTSDLYRTSSSMNAQYKIATNIPNAVAVTWNSANNQIAILEETQGHNGPGPVGFFYTPSIVIVNAQSGAVIQQINLPASNSTFSPECGMNCTTPRARIQWGANGTFLLDFGNVGTTFVTPAGQAHEFATTQNLRLDEGALGAMNAQGTLVAYPAVNNGQVTITLYPVNTSGNIGTPTTLANMAEQNANGDNPTLDFSPDGTKVGLCDAQLIGVASTQHAGSVQTIATLPSDGQGTNLNCENLRWTADGQSLVAQTVGYNINSSGLIVLPISGATPTVLFGCNLSYSGGIQYDSNGGSNCNVGALIYSMQPEVHEQSNIPLQTMQRLNNNSKLLAQGTGTSLAVGPSQGDSLTVNAGQQFTVYFDYENTGTTTWTDASGFALTCDQVYMPKASCMEGAAQGLNNDPVLPGGQAVFFLTLTAPTQSGTYQTSWDMRDSSGIFGQNHVYFTVSVNAASLEAVDWSNFTYTTSNCYSNGPAQYTVHNGSVITSQGVNFIVQKPIFGDLTGDGQPEAVILYSCVAADSSGPFAQVFTGNAAKPVLIGDLTLQSNGMSAGISNAAIINGNLQLSGAGYAPGDAHCCPSLQVTTVYHWNGTQFVVASTNSTPSS